MVSIVLVPVTAARVDIVVFVLDSACLSAYASAAVAFGLDATDVCHHHLPLSPLYLHERILIVPSTPFHSGH